MASIIGGIVGAIVGGFVSGTFDLGMVGYFAVGFSVWWTFAGCRWFAREMTLGMVSREKRDEARNRLGW